MFGKQKYRDNENWYVRHSLSLVLVLIFLLHMVGYHFTSLPTWMDTQEAHGKSTALWPDYWLHYAAGLFRGMLADTYGALILVLLTKWFYERGSAESNDEHR